MIIDPIRTRRISPKSCTLLALLDEAVHDMPPGSILAITSKIVSLCEGSVVPRQGADKQALVRQHSDWYLPDSVSIKSKWGINFTVTDGALIPNAGIDESNAGDVLVLWPADAQATANQVRKYLTERFGNQDVGVVVTDSTCRPLRRGVSGIAMAFSGFKPLRDYVGVPDLFDRPFKVSQSDIVGGIAAAAVLMMGEGSESTPLAILRDVTVAEFVGRDPSAEELAELHISIEDDLFAPFLEQVEWLPGGNQHTQ